MNLRTKINETASLPNTIATQLAKYFIAVGFMNHYEQKPQEEAFRKIAKEALANINHDSLRKIGINPSFFKTLVSATYVSTLSTSLKASIKKNLVDNPKVPQEEAQAAYQAILFVARSDRQQPQLDRIQKLAVKLSPKFGAEITEATGTATKDSSAADVAALYAQLSDVVKDATGKAGVKIPADTLKKMRENVKGGGARNAAYYNSIRTKIASKYDIDMSNFVSRFDKPPYIHEIYAHMKKLGYKTHRIVAAEKKIPLRATITAGKITYYTEDGRQIDGGLPADAEKITFMKTYDVSTGAGAYLSYTTPSAAGVTRKYTTEHKSTAIKQKFDKADSVSMNVDKYILKWTRDMSSKDDTTAMAATVCMLIYKTGMRVGSKIGSRSISGAQSYGALTLLAKQVKATATKITLKYAGKKQVSQLHVLPIKDKVDKIILRNIKEFLIGKAPDDLVFSYENHRGTIKRLNPAQLTSYLKNMGFTVGIHKIRHIRGTNLAVALLNKNTWKPKPTERSLAARQRSGEEFIKTKILKPVAQLLGHKAKDGKEIWQTSISNYLNPMPFVKWFKDNGLRLPKWVPIKAE